LGSFSGPVVFSSGGSSTRSGVDGEDEGKGRGKGKQKEVDVEDEPRMKKRR
jgi:hypothetical protein